MTFGPKDAEEALIYAQENLIVDFQHAIQKLLNLSGMSRRELAARSDMNEAQLSQLFKDSANPTLKTVARVFYALGDECILTSRYLEKLGGREHPTAKWEIAGDRPVKVVGEATVEAISHVAPGFPEGDVYQRVADGLAIEACERQAA